MKRQQKSAATDDEQLGVMTTQEVDVEADEERETFTAGWDESEALVLAPFSLAVADVEVDMDWSGQPLVPVGRNLHQQAVLQQRPTVVTRLLFYEELFLNFQNGYF